LTPEPDLKPMSNGLQSLPFQRAMPYTKASPARVNQPAATRSPPGRSASALTLMPDIEPPMPVPSARQEAPSHCAMRLAATPPAVVKDPPATMSPFGRTSSEDTVSFIPEPKECHALPSQRAICPTWTPPASWKDPPATKSPL